jgi:transposase, IS6 family
LVLSAHGERAESVTDRASTLLAIVDELMPGAFHHTSRYANNRIEADHGRLKARIRPMRGLKRDRTASVIMRGHAFIGEPPPRPLRTRRRRTTRANASRPITELARAIYTQQTATRSRVARSDSTQQSRSSRFAV